MSISDRIVVMKSGELQQSGKPQSVYDDPVNLFVAKFLGTPPINVFEGEVRNERLYVGEDDVLPAPGVEDRKVWVGIRPEGFVLSDEGSMHCALERIEVMGRDMSIIAKHPACTAESLRAIIDAENISRAGAEVRFDLKPGKVHIFDFETEERIRVRA